MYMAAHILAILVLVRANHDWWEKHKDSTDPKVDKECYECNAWISRFIISTMLQSALALFLCAFIYRYQKLSSKGSPETKIFKKVPKESPLIDSEDA